MANSTCNTLRQNEPNSRWGRRGRGLEARFVAPNKANLLAWHLISTDGKIFDHPVLFCVDIYYGTEYSMQE
jgi:hypothetical protein